MHENHFVTFREHAEKISASSINSITKPPLCLIAFFKNYPINSHGQSLWTPPFLLVIIVYLLHVPSARISSDWPIPKCSRGLISGLTALYRYVSFSFPKYCFNASEQCSDLLSAFRTI